MGPCRASTMRATGAGGRTAPAPRAVEAPRRYVITSYSIHYTKLYEPTGGYIEQADGNSWMALYAQNMLEISLELVRMGYTEYNDKVVEYYNHFLEIGSAIVITSYSIHYTKLYDITQYIILKLIKQIFL